MTYQEFKTSILSDLPALLPRDTGISLKQITKNNDRLLDGLVLMPPDTNIGPTFYLNDYFREFEKGASYDSILSGIARLYEECRIHEDVNISFFSDFEEIRDRIVFRLVNRKKNARLLSDVPYLPWQDLAIVFCCLLQVSGEMMSSILLHESHLALWDVTVKDLMHYAGINTPVLLPPDIFDINTLLTSHQLPLPELESSCPLLVLTNENRMNGAASLLYPGILQNIAEKMECDLFIIPSSIHEVLLFPVSGDGPVPDIADLNRRIPEVNAEPVSPGEVLSDHVYLYSRSQNAVICPTEEYLAAS